jgi:hypothetical protein
MRRELWENQVSMSRCTTGGGHKDGILEDTLMSEKGAWERAGRLREANWALVASAARTPPIGAKAQGALRGILHGSKRRSRTPGATLSRV